jgi:fucose permease
MSGTAAGAGTLISTYLIGVVTDRFSFQPVIIAASLIPCFATVIFVTLVRAGRKPDPRGLLQDF